MVFETLEDVVLDYTAVVDCVEMSPNDKDYKALKEQVAKHENLLAQSSWLQRNPVYTWLITLGVSIGGLCLTLFWGILPHLKDYAKLQVDSQVKEAIGVQNKKLDDIGLDVATIKGELKVYDQLLKDYVTDKLKKSAQLSSKELIQSLPKLTNTIASAREAKVSVDPMLVVNAGRRIFEISSQRSDQAIWQAALDLVGYRSSLNVSPIPPVEAVPVTTETLYGTYVSERSNGAMRLRHYGDVPIEKAAIFEPLGSHLNKNNQRGDAFIIVSDGEIALDGSDIKNVIFENVRVAYGGGPIRMENVSFVNCTFDLPQNQHGEEFGLAVLEHPSVGFSLA